MSIRLKIVLVVVPLILATLLLTGVSSYFSATSGITGISRDFLGFKADELRKNAESQWGLLVENNLTARPEMVEATKAAVESYAKSLTRSATELIFAVAPGRVAVHGQRARGAARAPRPRAWSSWRGRSAPSSAHARGGRQGQGGQGLLVRAIPVVRGGERGAGSLLQLR